MMAVRHVASFLALPFVMTVVVPSYVIRRNPTTLRWPNGVAEMLIAASAVLLFAIGAALFLASLREFITRGRGTLAPWDPPRNLVVHGPYRYVRNPMISGVVALIAAEAILLRSLPLANWAGLFAAINLIYIPLYEEPQLESRFGEAYREYRRHVPRLFPRFSPWVP
jgi:protein-S-isoprenylcysteine O-methyltransferase Ste14